jgi:hypothetical protein
MLLWHSYDVLVSNTLTIVAYINGFVTYRACSDALAVKASEGIDVADITLVRVVFASGTCRVANLTFSSECRVTKVLVIIAWRAGAEVASCQPSRISPEQLSGLALGTLLEASAITVLAILMTWGADIVVGCQSTCRVALISLISNVSCSDGVRITNCAS